MAYSLETSSVKTIVPGAEVSGFADVVARQKISALSSEVPKLSAGEGIDISLVDDKTVITNNISAGQNISLIYDQETNTYRIDAASQDISAYTLTGADGIDVSTDHVNRQTIVSYTGTMGDPAVNNVVRSYSANGTWLTAHQSLSNYYQKTETSSKQEISAAIDYISSNAGLYTGVAPIQVNNTNHEISITGESLSAGPGIDMFSSGGYVVISANGGGGGGAIYTGISPIDVNNTTHQISAKGVSFGVQNPLFFVQDDNEAVIIGCSAGGGTTYTGDAQGALDEVYVNSGVWLTAHQDLSNYYTTAEANTLSSMFSGAIDYVSANAGGSDSYSAGDYISIDNNTISVTGLDNSNIFWVTNSSIQKDVYEAYQTGKKLIYIASDKKQYLLGNVSNNLFYFYALYTDIFVYPANVRRFTITASSSSTSTISVSTEKYSLQANWNETNTFAPAYINNKPVLSAYAYTSAVDNKLDTSSFSDVSSTFLTGVNLSSLNDAGVNNIVYTASLPAEPDANTLYLIPEA